MDGWGSDDDSSVVVVVDVVVAVDMDSQGFWSANNKRAKANESWPFPHVASTTSISSFKSGVMTRDHKECASAVKEMAGFSEYDSTSGHCDDCFCCCCC